MWDTDHINLLHISVCTDKFPLSWTYFKIWNQVNIDAAIYQDGKLIVEKNRLRNSVENLLWCGRLFYLCVAFIG